MAAMTHHQLLSRRHNLEIPKPESFRREAPQIWHPNVQAIVSLERDKHPSSPFYMAAGRPTMLLSISD